MKKWSAVPLYAVAALWILWTWLMPLYAPLHYVILILLSAGVYAALAVILNRKKPEKTAETPQEQKPAEPDPEKKPERRSTGNPELDKLILDRDRAVSEMRRLNDSISNPVISAQIDDLEATTTRIIDHVLEHPEKLPQIRKFMSYYLPTTLKLLNIYDRMGAQGVREENIGGTMEKVEDTFGRIVQAYHKQLDALFADEALDVSTDITVMENLLRQEGFMDDGSDILSGASRPMTTSDFVMTPDAPAEAKNADESAPDGAQTAQSQSGTAGAQPSSDSADTTLDTAADTTADGSPAAPRTADFVRESPSPAETESGASSDKADVPSANEGLPQSPFGEQKPIG